MILLLMIPEYFCILDIGFWNDFFDSLQLSSSLARKNPSSAKPLFIYIAIQTIVYFFNFGLHNKQ